MRHIWREKDTTRFPKSAKSKNVRRSPAWSFEIPVFHWVNNIIVPHDSVSEWIWSAWVGIKLQLLFWIRINSLTFLFAVYALLHHRHLRAPRMTKQLSPSFFSRSSSVSHLLVLYWCQHLAHRSSLTWSHTFFADTLYSLCFNNIRR